MSAPGRVGRAAFNLVPGAHTRVLTLSHVRHRPGARPTFGADRVLATVVFLLASWPAIAQSPKERAVSTLAEATATAEFVEGVCFLRKRDARIDELTAQADVSKQDMEPGGQYGAIVARHRERVRSRLASSLK